MTDPTPYVAEISPRQGFKFVAADLTSRDRQFSYLEALRTGEPIEATNVDPGNTGPCPSREGDGLCVAKTVRGACSGGQSAASAVGLLVEYSGVLGEDDDKVRVRSLTVTGVFDPLHLICLGLCPNLRGANLGDAYLGGANLRDANLRGANLRGANLRFADLRGANLRDADLGGANLRFANLGSAYLGGAYLRFADLGGADLGDAYLRDADLGGAYLGGANLRDAAGFRAPAGAIR